MPLLSSTRRLGLTIALAIALALGLAFPPTSWVQEPIEIEEDDVGPMAWASLSLADDQPVTLQVVTSKSTGEIAIAMATISGHPPLTTSYGVGWTQLTTELPAPVRDRLLLRKEVALGPLLEVLYRRGQQDLLVQIHHPRAAYAHVTGTQAFAIQGMMSTSVPTATPNQPLVIDVGWRAADVVRTVFVLLLAFLWPIVAGLMVWRRSIVRDRTPQAWFPRAHTLQNLVIAGWVVWIVAIDATLVDSLISFALGKSSGWILAGPLCMLGFLPAALLMMAMVRRIVRRLRGFDPQARGGMVVLLRVLVPLVLLCVAATAFFAQDPRTGVFALLGAIAAAALLPGARGPLGTAPQALSSGPLRDRLFDLARRAGVKLRELYVAPMRQQRMANAFAVNGGVVMVTDELLDRMSRREVDAVLAHEISHLEHHHPLMLVAGAGLAWAVVSVATMAIGFAFMVPLGIAASWLAYLFVARRCEFLADAGAAALTGDAEAMISGLGQLARLNDTPLTWSRRRGWLITHPTTEARARAIGRRAGIAEARVAELLAVGLADPARYELSERPGEGERVFSTAWKSRTIGRLSLTIFGSAVAVPALAVALARWADVPTPHALVILGGAGLAFLALVIGQDLLAARGVSRLEPALRARLAEADASESRAIGRETRAIGRETRAIGRETRAIGRETRANGPETRANGRETRANGRETRFVALSPGEQPRVYEGFLDWDLGLLTIKPDSLHYRGEQVSFDLPRDAIRAIDVGSVAPAWLRAPRVIVRWQAPDGEAALTLRAGDCRRVSEIGGTTQKLAEQLRSWRGTPSPTPVVGPPPIGPVTAITIAHATGLRDLPILLVLLGTFAAAATYLLGLDFRLGLDLLAAALMGLMILRWPAMTAREPAPIKEGTPEPERRAA